MGAGFPPAKTVKTAFFPKVATWLVGWLVIVAASVMLRVAARLAAEPAAFDTTQRNCTPVKANAGNPARLMFSVAVAVPLNGEDSETLTQTEVRQTIAAIDRSAPVSLSPEPRRMCCPLH